MKIFTEKVKKCLQKYPLYSQDGKGVEAVAVVKLFIASGAWTWYVTEADLSTGELFGIVVNGAGECEYGYFQMEELEGIIIFGLGVERDMSFTPTKLNDIQDSYLKSFFEKNVL